jgi:hypothetical protein
MPYFSDNFLVDAATAAHQVEGNNTQSYFWAMEQVPGSIFKEASLDCADHYHCYREDIDLLAGAGLNAYRFSIEWARIQPDKDSFGQKETKHYRAVLRYCREKGVTPVVTMRHFSSPKWLIMKWVEEGVAPDLIPGVWYNFKQGAKILTGEVPLFRLGKSNPGHNIKTTPAYKKYLERLKNAKMIKADGGFSAASTYGGNHGGRAGHDRTERVSGRNTG